MTGEWSCNTTWPGRYDDFGVTGYILLYAQYTGKATVIDVGCSTGEAMAECKQCLSKHGIDLYTIGIDMLDDNAAEAEKNLDKFIHKKACEVNEYIGEADIVVCLNTVRSIRKDNKSDTISKCAEFLKPDGVLITGIDKKHRKMLKLEYTKISPPKKVCPRKGWHIRICNMLSGNVPSDTRMMKRDSVLTYERIIQTEWKRMNCLDKKIHMFNLWCKRGQAHFGDRVRRSPLAICDKK